MASDVVIPILRNNLSDSALTSGSTRTIIRSVLAKKNAPSYDYRYSKPQYLVVTNVSTFGTQSQAKKQNIVECPIDSTLDFVNYIIELIH